MNILENLLMFAGISFEVFAVMEIQGAKVPVVKKDKLARIAVVTVLFQIAFFTSGYEICKLFGDRFLDDKMYAAHIIAALIYLGLAVRLGVKAIKRETVFEHRCEMVVKDYAKIIGFVAIYTFFAGCAAGLVETNILVMFIIIAVFSILAVVAGLYVGYHLGYKGKTYIYAIGSILLIATAIEIIVKNVII